MASRFEKYVKIVETTSPLRATGVVTEVIGLGVEVDGIAPQVGEVCWLHPQNSSGPVPAEVVGFRGERSVLMPLGELSGVKAGTRVSATGSPFRVPVGPSLLGRVLDGLGRPIDGKGPLDVSEFYTLANEAPHPLRRQPITKPLSTGIRTIDGLLTCGKGQRIGIFSGSGVGKSTLMGMIARYAKSDVNVVALIGERGREVREFIERDLTEEGLRRSVVVVSTSDQPALVRIKGAWVATVIAEYFRDQSADVAFMMDSVTRFAMAQREVGLTIGEPPASKGYTPSVFALLPRLMERTGCSDKGTITGFYTVLMEADDITDTIVDVARSILDGHIVLTRELAAENHFPAIDVLNSISRSMPSIVAPDHRRLAGRIREVLATYYNARDLINIGAYVPGSNPNIDYALSLLPRLIPFLRQDLAEHTDFDETLQWLGGLLEETDQPVRVQSMAG
jgi:flagellum-specific ATP synthase